MVGVGKLQSLSDSKFSNKDLTTTMRPIVGILFCTILSQTCADEQLMCIACGFPKVVKDKYLIKSQKGLEVSKADLIANEIA